jgi:hypothetical protein
MRVKVHAKGTWRIVATKTGEVLANRLTLDKEFEIDAPMEQEIVRRALAESDLRMQMVQDFYEMLKASRIMYLRIGGTQWSVDPVDIKYEYSALE